jgi:hypothetical protein
MWVMQIFVSEAEYPLQVDSSADILYEITLGFSVDLACDCNLDRLKFRDIFSTQHHFGAGDLGWRPA